MSFRQKQTCLEPLPPPFPPRDWLVRTAAGAGMTQPGARFSGAIVGAMPDSLASSSTSATELTTAVWTLALEVGDQHWEEAWSPARDELVRPKAHARHKSAWQTHRSALNRAKDKFEKVLAQRFAEALHGADATVGQLALALERVRAGDYTSLAGSARRHARPSSPPAA